MDQTPYDEWLLNILNIFKEYKIDKEATGIDLSEIINADSYDAKVNRNVNVTGLDGVNLVVNADTDKNVEKTEN